MPKQKGGHDGGEHYGLDRTLIKKSGLKKLVELSWHQIKPGITFILGWHIDAICEHLEAISRGQLTRLVINILPGCMNAMGVDV